MGLIYVEDNRPHLDNGVTGKIVSANLNVDNCEEIDGKSF